MTNRSAILSCSALLLLFAAVAWTAVQTKSATYDEPYHGVSAWLQLRHHDFRLDYQDPPLWQYWASIPNGAKALHADFKSAFWTDMPQRLPYQWYWTVTTLYRTPGNNAVRLINRNRAMMLVLSVVLGALICVWSWRLSGPVAAIMAGVLFSLDPNFLAHSALMKNDVVFSLTMFALTMTLWKAGKKITPATLGLICAACIATLTVKFSGILAAMLVPSLLALRALSPEIWTVLGKQITTRWHRLLVAIAITAIVGVVSYVGIWAVYGFRFRPSSEPNVWLNLDQLTQQIQVNTAIAEHQNSTRSPALVRAALFANAHGLLPQAYIAGFLFTYSTAILRYTFAAGQYSFVGWWWYFPFAILVKTPVTTLILAAISTLMLIKARRISPATRWAAICLIVPIVMFLASAMMSDLNIGLRHIMPIYPFAFVAIACVSTQLWNKQGRKAHGAFILAAILLATESLSAYPNFIPYFNVIASHIAGEKANLLGDSNLDWGQDLPLLAQWQNKNPNATLYLCYFGLADPAYYGIKYIPLPGGYHYDPSPKFVDPYSPCVVAISATNLQGVLLNPELRKYYAAWAKRKPREIIGDSIYLYDYDPRQMMMER